MLCYSLKQSAACEHLTAHSMSSLPAATAACSVQSEEEASPARVLFSLGQHQLLYPHNITQAFYDDEVNCLVTSFIFGCETEHKTCKYETNISSLLSLLSHKTVEDCTTVCNEKPGSPVSLHRVYNMMLTLLWTLV